MTKIIDLQITQTFAPPSSRYGRVTGTVRFDNGDHGLWKASWDQRAEKPRNVEVFTLGLTHPIGAFPAEGQFKAVREHVRRHFRKHDREGSKKVPLAQLRRKYGPVSDVDIEILAVHACEIHDERTFKTCSLALSGAPVAPWHRARAERLIYNDCQDQDRSVDEWARTGGR